MTIPYVVSEDIRLLLGYWCDEMGFSLPHNEFFDTLRSEFKDFFSKLWPLFEMVSEADLQRKIPILVSEAGIYPVSLDGVYFREGATLEITRVVDDSGNDCGYGSRTGTATLEEQYQRLFEHLRERNIKEVALVDDVVFTGSLLTMVSKRLVQEGIRTPVVCAGIVINDGTQKLGNPDDRIVRCVYRYRAVIDEICERDFYPGVPLCGRTLARDNTIGIPYIRPFGYPDRWASVPDEWIVPLSRFCLNQTQKLFGEIQRKSNREVLCKDLWRTVHGLQNGETPYLKTLVDAQNQLFAPE